MVGARQQQRRRRHLPAAAGGSNREQQPGARPDLYLGLPEQTGAARPEIFFGLPASLGEEEEAAFTSAPAVVAAMPAGLALAAAASLAGAVLLAAPLPAEALSLAGAVSGLEQLIQQAGFLGPLIFIAAYVAATVLLVPGSVLTLAAGFLFGPLLGTAVVSVASTAGAAAAFLVGRYVARPAVERRIQGNPRFAAVDAAIGRESAKIVLLLRLSPLFPFTLLNYALSLTKIEFVPYVLASWAGMIPGTVAYVALGGAGKAAAETAAGAGSSPLQLVLYAVGAVATLAATAVISKAAAKALEEAEAQAAGGQTGAEAEEPLQRRDSSD